MRSRDFINIQGWMLDLGLPDKQLMLYAILLNMTKGGLAKFTGSASYLAEWIGCKERQTRNIIRQLEDRGLLTHEVIYDETKRCPISVFWAYYPDQTPPPGQGGKKRISWSGSCNGLQGQIMQRIAGSDHATDCRVHVDSNKNITTSQRNIRRKTSRDNAQLQMVVFNPPTVQEVQEYARARGFADPAGFADYYVAAQTEMGWVTGKGSNRKPIDNWKLNVLAWERNHKNRKYSPETEAAPERRTRQLTAEEIAKYFPGV